MATKLNNMLDWIQIGQEIGVTYIRWFLYNLIFSNWCRHLLITVSNTKIVAQ